MNAVSRQRMSSGFWLLWSGQTISFLGTNITLIAIPWMVLSLTHSALQTSLTFALEYVPSLLLSIPAGTLADRFDRKQLMVSANLVSALALASIPVASAIHSLSMTHIMSVVLVVNASAVISSAAGTACVPNLVGKDSIYRANSLLQMGLSIGGTFGTPLGGLLIAVFPASDVILLDSLSYLVCAISLWCIRAPFQVGSAQRRTWHAMWEGIQFIVRFPLFRINAVILACTNFTANAIFAVLVFHMKDELHMTGLQSGIVLGTWGIGMFAGSTISTKFEARWTTATLFRVSRVIAVLPPFLYALCNGWFWLCVASAMTGMSMVMYTIQSVSLRQQYTPDELRGRVGIAHTMLARFGIPLGAAIGGFTATRAGAHPVFVCAAIVQGMMLIVVWKSSLSRLGIRGTGAHSETSGMAS